ncbi:MAG: serine acetyltransferase [Opitutaceae bacterium]
MSQSWTPINSKSDLQEFLSADLKHRGLKKLPRLYQLRKPIVHYTVLLRKTEFLLNTASSPLGKFRASVSRLRLKRMGSRLGFTIAPNTFGPGLYLMHWGSIAISAEARIGRNARVHSCVNIAGRQEIGDNVYLAPGAKLFGDITIGNNVAIGANAVVSTSQPDGVTLMGNPARVVKRR